MSDLEASRLREAGRDRNRAVTTAAVLLLEAVTRDKGWHRLSPQLRDDIVTFLRYQPPRTAGGA